MTAARSISLAFSRIKRPFPCRARDHHRIYTRARSIGTVTGGSNGETAHPVISRPLASSLFPDRPSLPPPPFPRPLYLDLLTSSHPRANGRSFACTRSTARLGSRTSSRCIAALLPIFLRSIRSFSLRFSTTTVPSFPSESSLLSPIRDRVEHILPPSSLSRSRRYIGVEDIVSLRRRFNTITIVLWGRKRETTLHRLHRFRGEWSHRKFVGRLLVSTSYTWLDLSISILPLLINIYEYAYIEETDTGGRRKSRYAFGFNLIRFKLFPR